MPFCFAPSFTSLKYVGLSCILSGFHIVIHPFGRVEFATEPFQGLSQRSATFLHSSSVGMYLHRVQASSQFSSSPVSTYWWSLSAKKLQNYKRSKCYVYIGTLNLNTTNMMDSVTYQMIKPRQLQWLSSARQKRSCISSKYAWWKSWH